ncbi:hypothetical protein INT43_002217 [Umbelopsis isabellina]|uniref:Calcineurin-like phosphoesterase domain-containing protein n=1 Tax=Mortierella isabellina TaxID=91625 RepID=A0A8H7UJT7_MORIS|nr:hypothetical protein INT43_002217 [Umbelopsis isabellina]
MDGGREWADNREWIKEVQRFKKVFSQRSSNTKHYYMAGNHDLGFGDGIKPSVVERFENEFGETSYELSLDSHSIVVVDSVSMSSTSAQINHKSRDFVRQLRPSDKPRILFSHVPLYRQPSPISGTLTAPAAEDMCGPLRQKSKQIRQGVGYQYQNLMTKELTDIILTHAQPDMIFSGDDHDYCEVFHAFEARKIPEISVNTFSMAQGVKYPGVVLLNLYAGDVPKSESYTTKLCLLPDQISIFIRYAILLGITLAGLLANNILDLFGYSLLSTSSPIMPSTRQEADKADAREHRYLSQRRILISRSLEAIKRTAKDIRQIALPSLLFYLICVLLL